MGLQQLVPGLELQAAWIPLAEGGGTEWQMRRLKGSPDKPIPASPHDLLYALLATWSGKGAHVGDSGKGSLELAVLTWWRRAGCAHMPQAAGRAVKHCSALACTGSEFFAYSAGVGAGLHSANTVCSRSAGQLQCLAEADKLRGGMRS